MEQIKRFDIVTGPEGGAMREAEEGEYVLYKDHISHETSPNRPLIVETIIKRDTLLNAVEKAHKYNADVEALRKYIFELEDKNCNLQAMLSMLKDPKKHFEALKQIQAILNESVGFPVPL
jgi:5-methylcytosine-specific restriction endonuclease McrBC regulatory subunit McrC